MADSPTTTIPSSLPVLPLRETVAFPLSILPLGVNRAVSIDAVQRALQGDRMLFLTLQSTATDDPGPDDMHRVGTVGIIRQMARTNAGLQIIVEGLQRAHAAVVNRTGETMSANISPQPEEVTKSIEVDAYVRRIQEQVDRALSLTSSLSQELRGVVSNIEDPLRLAYLLASLLDRNPMALGALGLFLGLGGLYQIYLGGMVGQTLGKRWFGLRVISTRGVSPTPSRAIARYLAQLLSVLPVGLGFVWCLFDRERRAAHDHLAGTYVVLDD